MAEYDGSGNRTRAYVHGVSYVDERLMMHDDAANRPYYYAVDRMYNVVMLIDRAGAIVERYCYDAYGRPYIRESMCRGDFNSNGYNDSIDDVWFDEVHQGNLWDPRADMDDDGDVDSADGDLYWAKIEDWQPDPVTGPTVAEAFSDVGNPYMFQGVPQFALDTAADAAEGKLLLNHHRQRFVDCPTGRWNTRDPLYYGRSAIRLGAETGRKRFEDTNTRHEMNLYLFVRSNPVRLRDHSGLQCTPGSTLALPYNQYCTYCGGLRSGGQACVDCKVCQPRPCFPTQGTWEVYASPCGACPSITPPACPAAPPPPPPPPPSCCAFMVNPTYQHCTDCCLAVAAAPVIPPNWQIFVETCLSDCSQFP